MRTLRVILVGALVSFGASLVFQREERRRGAESRLAPGLGRVVGTTPLLTSAMATISGVADGMPWPLALLVGGATCPLLLTINLWGMRAGERLGAP